MSIQLARARRLLNLPVGTPWPDCFSPEQLAILQEAGDEYIPGLPGLPNRIRDIATALKSDCETHQMPTGLAWERPAHTFKMRSFDGVTAHDTGEATRQADTVFQKTHFIYREAFAQWLRAEGMEPSLCARAWLDSAQPQARQSPPVPEVTPAPAAPPEAVLMPPQAVPAAVAESWHIKKPERAHGYTWQLYSVLKAAHDAGKPCPKPRDVLDSWQASKPLNIPEVMSDGFKYLDSNGNTEPVDIDSLRKAIYRMTKAR